MDFIARGKGKGRGKKACPNRRPFYGKTRACHRKQFILYSSQVEVVRTRHPDELCTPDSSSPRYLKQEIIEAGKKGWPILIEPLALIDCSLSEEEIAKKFPKFWDYLRKAKTTRFTWVIWQVGGRPGIPRRKGPSHTILCTYMGRAGKGHFDSSGISQTRLLQTFICFYIRKNRVTHILNTQPTLWETVFKVLQSIHPEEFFSEGRVYGGGLYKMEPAELMRLPADDLAKILGVHKSEQLVMF